MMQVMTLFASPAIIRYHSFVIHRIGYFNVIRLPYRSAIASEPVCQPLPTPSTP